MLNNPLGIILLYANLLLEEMPRDTGAYKDIKTIEPGDSIIVPEKLDRVAWLREIKDWAETVS